MTLALRYAVRSDVGLLREGNEDSAYAGPRLLAVADGMGGHAAGEVASAVAISALAHLDDDMPGTDLVDALGEAVRNANKTLHEMVIANPALDGMGTTLTAMLWSGPRVALCHIGDSRAYLLRDNELYQITHDHTLVQKLQDEGRISPDEAATHPQRSLILRALDGRGEAEPDLSLREARIGDRYLLCSDGLSGVVSAETLHRTLTTVPEPDRAVIQLVDLANRGGGPDNITCIVADVVDSATAKRAPTDLPVLAGAASNGRGLPQASLPRPDTPAGRANALTHTAPQPAITDLGGPSAANGHDVAEDVDTGDVRPRRRWPIVTGVLVVLFAVIAGGAFVAWRYSQSQYYVASDGGRVAIFRGINEKVAGLSLRSVYQRTTVPLTAVPVDDRTRIAATIQATNLADAQRIVSQITQEVRRCQAAQAQLAQYEKSLSTYQKELKTWNKTHKGNKPTKPLKPVVPPQCPPATASPNGTPTGATPAPSAGAT
jgi:PPM family protein phosphatase